MSKRKAIIVCDGKKIDCGINLLHLHRFSDENVSFMNENAEFDVEIYSSAAFRHVCLPKDTVEIFAGDVKKPDSSFETLYSRWNISIWRSAAELIVKADPGGLFGDEYAQFLEYANKKREEFMETAREYVQKVEKIDTGWIAGRFKEAPYRDLFGQTGRIKAIRRQQYDCAGFALYLDYLQKEM